VTLFLLDTLAKSLSFGPAAFYIHQFLVIMHNKQANRHAKTAIILALAVRFLCVYAYSYRHFTFISMK